MNISTLISKIKKTGAKKALGGVRHPQRDWLLLVGGALFFFFAIALWSFISFQLQISDTGEAAQAQSGPELQAVSVDTVQAVFEKRARARLEYQSGKKFIDPSR
jgi:hypothetical protein